MVRPVVKAPPRAAALARRLFATVLVVLTGFVLTLVYGYTTLAPVEMRAESVALNALPSARHLSLARSSLTELVTAIQPTLVGRGAGAHVTKSVDAARARLQAAVDAELAAPMFPGEAELAAEMVGTLETLDARTADLLASSDAPTEVRVARTREWLAAVTASDDAIARVARFNLDQGELEARTIAAIHRRAEVITLVIFGLTLIGATIAGVLTLRLLRQTDRETAVHEQILQDRADELEAFAGRVAHDLKDPLGTLSMRLGLMRTQLHEPETLGGAIDKAATQIQRMDTVIVSLLELARAGGQPAPGARAELHDVVDQVVEDFSPAASSADIELRVDPFPPEQVACTPGALSSVVRNLVGNALKYVVDGREPVRQVRVRVAEQPGAVRVEVRDNGPGLPPGTEQTVFEPFVRVGRSKRAGTGLGLAIVRRIVEAHGGRVGVESAPGVGSCFWFEMPKARAGV